MLTVKVFLFLITLCVAKSEMDYETMCKSDFRDEKNNSIDVTQYCSDKICIEKCCGLDEIMMNYKQCITYAQFQGVCQKYPYIKSQYDSINILFFDVTRVANKKVVFIENKRNSFYLNNCTAPRDEKETYVLTEDGSLQGQDPKGPEFTIKKLHYCVDRNIVVIKEKTNITLKIKSILRGLLQNSENRKQIAEIEIIGLSISSFFLLLVLIVYCLLPDLRNFTGLILMAYTWTLLVAFIMKIFMNNNKNRNICQIVYPVQHFSFVSSIFWLSVYAFEVWWGLRNLRIKRNSKHGKLMKFLWSALYAWGTPLLLTTIIVVLTHTPVKLAVNTPLDCKSVGGDPVFYYYYIPIGIITLINIVLFCMTVYNIWIVKRTFNECHDSSKSKQQNNKFSTYAKLFLMMGVSWCMELIPSDTEVWIYVVINLYNLLIGVTIFYLFVCKTTILLQLCKKFNIRKEYMQILQLKLTRKSTQSGITKTTDPSSTIKRTSQDPVQADLMQNCSEEETTVV